MQGTSIMVRVLTVIMMCLVLASATPAAERMTVITYYNMTKGSEEQIKPLMENGRLSC